ncbi:hypothetical protein [Paraburkholderia sp.]|uniref:hypothetical protein n=1 Tax=Paraburkholderia sp. TaxID=1926495 RepID=UPI00257C9AB1|nr:hypothetical protein [Paraburkholderia sp.]
MTLTSLQNNSDTEALLQACVSFDPSDASHKVVMRKMVIPMLERRLGQLHLAARVAPASEPIQSAIQEITAVLSDALARLDQGQKPPAQPDALDLPARAIDHADEMDQGKEADRKRQARRS